MPLLGGIFKKKSRPNVDDTSRSNSITSQRSDPDSPLSSPTSEYVKADSTLPSSPNGRNTLHPNNGGQIRSVYPNVAASSSKLRLGFGRKKSSATGSATGSTNDEQDYPRPPRPSFSGGKLASVASDTDVSDLRRLGPPPSRSAVFAAQEGALSTRSLPHEKVSQDISTMPSQPSKKRPSIFPWSAKSQPSTASKATSNQLNSDDALSPTAPNEDSFNLKSFRHVQPSSNELQYNSSSSSLIPPAVPRPRNGSVGSDSAQRISVAAFREAQARRSAAGSPVPSLRSHSPHGLQSLPLSQSSLGDFSQTRSRPGISPTNRNKRSSLALGYTSDSDEDETSEEESENDADGRELSRRRTVTHRMKSEEAGGKGRGRATQSELGHGSSSASSSAHHSKRDDNALRQQYLTQSNSNVYSGGVRPRASVSTSALTPNAAAKRASTLVAANSEMTIVAHGHENSSPNLNRKDSRPAAQRSESDSEDDAPLATLVAPRRPGSAMSLSSNQSLPGRPKPLIDINTLTGPAKGPLESSSKSQAGFTGGSTLLSGVDSSAFNVASSPLASVTSTQPPIRFISPPSSPKHANKSLPPMPDDNSAPQTPSGRKPPTRADTDTSSVTTTQTSSSSGQAGQDSGKKRDNLTERLTRVAQTRIGTSSPSESTSTNTKANDRSKDNVVIPRTSSPSPVTSLGESPVASPFSSRPLNGGFARGHRRASSDYTLKLDNFTATSPSTFTSSSSRSPQSPGSGFGSVSAVTSIEPELDTVEDIAALLGPGIKLITKNGEDPMEGVSDEDLVPFTSASFEKEPPPSPGRIAPIVIKERTPAPSFSVTSRPQHRQSSASFSGSIGGLLTSTTTTTMTTMSNSSGTSITTSTSKTTRAAALNDQLSVSAKQENSTEVKLSTTTKQSTKFDSSPFRKPSTFAKPKVSTTKTMVSSSSSSSESSSSESESESAKSPVSSIPSSTSQTPTSSFVTPAPRRPANVNAASRPRSSTMSSLASPQGAPAWANTRPGPVPTKPFAQSRESPASSTGDSSSGRLPITPGDGSEIGGSESEFSGKPSSRESSADRQRTGRQEPPGRRSGHQRQWSGGVSGLGLGKHMKRPSVAFEENGAEKGKARETPEEEEDRRRERRRSEARAAIDLGNVINGPGPVVDDDDDDDLPINQTGPGTNVMTGMNPMMAGSMPMMPGFPQQPGAPGWSPWPQMPPNPQMSQFMIPPPSDPAFFAAHQQAMMIAKQAYQMAVAQQAMAAAAEQWERGSAIGGFSSSQSMYGGSTPAPMMGSPYGMGMGMGGNGWSTGSAMFPSGGRSSVYGMGAQSEYGGGGGRGGGWNSSQSVYGESFGPSPQARASNPRTSMFSQRDSGYFPPVPPVPQQHKNPSRQPANPRNRAISQPATPSKSPKKPPPSSWKAGA